MTFQKRAPLGVITLLVFACSKSDGDPLPSGPDPVPTTAVKHPACAAVWEDKPVDLSEGSALAIVDSAESRVAVIGDSGTKGAYAEVDPTDGRVMAKGKLPLDDKASDDIEGAAFAQGVLYTITSSGWIREFTRTQTGYELLGSAYPIAAPGSPLVCKQGVHFNCAENYEGLCLDPRENSDSKCVGFAAGKTHGVLRCLRRDEKGRLVIDPTGSIAVAAPQTLSGCSMSTEGILWIGSNLFAANAVFQVKDWSDPSRAEVVHVANVGPGFAEGILTLSDGSVLRVADTGRQRSWLSKYRCSPATKPQGLAPDKMAEPRNRQSTP